MYIDAKKVGERVKKLRMAREMTQQELAYEFNVSLSAIGKIESGLRIPSIDMFAMIAEFFNVTIDYLALGKKK